MRILKFLFYTVLTILFIIAGIVFYCDARISASGNGKLYDDVNLIPYHKVGLLLGTSKYLSKGVFNPYYANRIKAAVKLLKAGKIKYIILSGNREENYNEPQSMREDLIKRGISPSIIYMDYKGYRTFDSMGRLKTVFGQPDVTVISQPFHNERALYIAYREDIVADGFNAKDVDEVRGFRTQVRERFARVKVFIDYIFGDHPNLNDEQISIPAE